MFAVIACLVLGGGAAAAYLLLSDRSNGRDTLGSVEPDLLDAASSASGDGESRASGGDERESESTDESLTPTEQGFPTDSMAEMREDAEELLREFHVALVERDYRYAWSLLTSRKRRKEEAEKTYAGWKEAQATLTPHLLPDEIEVQIDELEEDRVARVSVTGMGWTAPGSSCSEWSGLTWVRYESGSWRYDPGYSTTGQRRRRWEGRNDALLGVGC